jgi:RNA polymerase sigma-70 factor (ECF subfamily)
MASREDEAAVPLVPPSRGELLEDIAKRARKLARRLTDEPDYADDVGQKVAVKVMKQLDTDPWFLANPAERGPYVTTVATRIITDRWRRDRAAEERQPRVVIEMDELNRSTWGNPEEEFEERALRMVAVRAVEAMPARCRDVFRMRHDLGMERQEIAERLGMSIKTVDNQLTIGMHLLRDAIEKHEKGTDREMPA